MHMTHPTNSNGIPRLNTDPAPVFREYPKCVKLPDGRYVDVRSLEEEEELFPPKPVDNAPQQSDEDLLAQMEAEEAKLRELENQQLELQEQQSAKGSDPSQTHEQLAENIKPPQQAELTGKPWEAKGKGKK